MRDKASVFKIFLGILALLATAALMIFVIVPAIKEGQAPSGAPTPESREASSGLSTQAPKETTISPGDTPTPGTAEPVTTQPVTAEPDTTEPVTAEPVTTEPVTTAAPPTEPPDEAVPTPTPTDISVGPGDVHTKAYQSGTVYVTEGCGYGGYWFGETNSTRYCEAVSSVARAVEGKADVYCLICPISAGVMLADEVREDLGLSDENQAITWMYQHMDPLVKTVPVYGALKAHNDENIYFHTDHHWTALGAWYAYREFCAQKGIPAHDPADFEQYRYTDYLGSFVNYSNGNAELKANPDTLVAYVPKGTNTMTIYIEENGGYGKYSWPIVKDVSGYNRGSYYLGFVSGDRPWSYAHNEAVGDGSSVLIVKDSYGNALIPWLIDHYEHIYWIDYRTYPDWCPWAGVADSSISNFVERNNIQDVILCNNIGSTGSGANLSDMEQIFH